MAFEDFLVNLGYIGVFAIVLVLNIIPAFVPPTWTVLSLIYVLFPERFSPLELALVGCVASTLGRIVLSYIGTVSRGVMGGVRRESLDDVRRKIASKKWGGFVLSFLVALSPLPSNAYFIAIGVMKYQVIGVFLGFLLGRFISYWLTISFVKVASESFRGLFSSELTTVVLIDLLALASVIIFALIDWHKLIEQGKIGFIKPKFRFRRKKASSQ